MSKPGRILRALAIGMAALILVVGVAAIVIVQTDWFRNFARQKIIAATEDGTGGKVEVGSFEFDWRALEAVVTEFVIHGKEPPGSAPFVRASRVQVNLHLFSSLRRVLEISFLGVERPEANVIVFADGSTNIPSPKEKTPKPDTTVLDTVVDLAVDYFRISQGRLTFNSQKQAIDISGRNLRAELWFNMLSRAYKGQLSLQPIYVVSGRNTPVTFTVFLPVVLERKRVAFDGARLSTPASEVTIDSSLEDLNNPKTNVRVRGHIAVADLKNIGNVPLDLNATGVPSVLKVDGSVFISSNQVSIDGFHLGLGASNIEASGTLKDARNSGSLEFKARLALDELGRLTNSSARPGGVVVANGRATLDAANDYHITGNVEGRDLSFSQGAQRIRNVDVFSTVNLNPHRLDLEGLRLSALGAQFTGDASMQEFARYTLNGNLRDFDMQTASRILGETQLPYSGVVSGPIQAQGDLKGAGTKSITASARLAIAPGRRGIPMSGRIIAEYDGATDNVNIANSYITLPNTRLSLNGSLSNGLTVQLTTNNLNDLLSAASPGSTSFISLDGGQALFTGTLTGGVKSPRIAGHLAVKSFRVEGRRFDSLSSDIAAANNRASVSNGILLRGAMLTQFTGSTGLRNWSPTPNQPLTVTATVRNGDLADVMALAAQPSAGYSGALSLDASVNGSIGNPSGSANIQILNGTVKDEPFDRLQARVNLSDQLVTIPASSISAGSGQVNLTAEFRHPRESLSSGQLHAHVQSNEINLGRIRTLQRERPNTAGSVHLRADVNGALATTTAKGKQGTELSLTGLTLDAGAQNIQFDGKNYGELTAKASTTGQTVNYVLASNFAGSALKVNGATKLVREYPTTADANITNLPVQRILVLANRTDIPVRGNVSATAHVMGTIANPEGKVDLNFANGVLYDEPIDRMHVRVSYETKRLDVAQFEVVSGPAQVQLTARYDHPTGNLRAGDLQFRITSNRLELSRIRNVQKARPGLGGGLQINASGSASVREGTPSLLFHDLNADITASQIAAQGNTFGDLTLKAVTNGGRLNFSLDSNLAEAMIRGQGNAQLSGDYPLTAELTFNNVSWRHIQPLISRGDGQPPGFDAVAEGQVNVSGPATKADQLRGSLRIARLQLSTIPRTGASDSAVVISNQGPIAATLDHGVVRIESAHITGRQTDINLKGSLSLVQMQTMDLSLSAKANLDLLRSFDQDIYSSGNVEMAATLRGTLQKPLANGELKLQNASINYVDLPNGISNANGVIVFNGNTATIRSISAESGGGKVNLSGFVTAGDTLRIGLRATANSVRIRTQQGISILANALVTLTGTTQSSLASGSVTITRITYAPQSDFGSILTRSAPPVQAPASPNPLLEHMKLDVRVRTAAATAVQASLAQNVQLDADLRVHGTATRPAVQGRIVITEGDLVFFGSKYRVSSGTISFYNPTRIEPVLDISLETQAKGVNVILMVTGPIDNMRLSYTSDPPLQFQEIVSLLASGKTPTSDPTLLANQPSQPQQSFEQMGESALVSKAIADPVASRLQRVFGVSQLKIDPTFTSGSDLPQARITLQQQVSTNVTFTYITALDDPNTQIVRVEWSLNPQWSAIANRDEHGIVSLNFVYKKQFR